MSKRKFSFTCYTENGTGFNPVKYNRNYNRKWRAEKLEVLKSDPNHPLHGTQCGYACGCRCERCKAAKAAVRKRQDANLTPLQKKKRNKVRKRANERVLMQMQSDPNDPHHGTITGYSVGCRCDRCTAAYKEYYEQHKERYKATYLARLKQLEEDPADPRHGTLAGYASGCRCELCRAARKRYDIERQRRSDGGNGSQEVEGESNQGA